MFSAGKVNVLPAQVGAEGDVVRARIHHAGQACAQGLHVVQAVTGAAQGFQGAVRHGLDLIRHGDVRAGDHVALAQDLALLIHHADLHAGAAHVKTDVNHIMYLLIDRKIFQTIYLFALKGGFSCKTGEIVTPVKLGADLLTGEGNLS